MSKFLLSSFQVIEAEISRMEARRASILAEAAELKNAIKTLQKVVEGSHKKSPKNTQKPEQILEKNEVKNDPNFE